MATFASPRWNAATISPIWATVSLDAPLSTPRRDRWHHRPRSVMSRELSRGVPISRWRDCNRSDGRTRGARSGRPALGHSPSPRQPCAPGGSALMPKELAVQPVAAAAPCPFPAVVWPSLPNQRPKALHDPGSRSAIQEAKNLEMRLRQINRNDAQTVFYFAPFLSVETAEVFWYSRVRSAESCCVGLIDS